MADIRHTLEAKSDQLNADDLIGGAIDVTIEAVDVRDSPDQPAFVHLQGRPGRPWKPCKGMRRLLAALWGTETDDWLGHRLRLYRDPEVTWGGEKTGGVRVSHADIPEPFRVAIAEKRGKKRMYEVLPLPPALPEVMTRLSLSPDQVSAWLVGKGRPPLDALDDRQRDQLAGHLPRVADEIRAL
jgi:hypothetical protein